MWYGNSIAIVIMQIMRHADARIFVVENLWNLLPDKGHIEVPGYLYEYILPQTFRRPGKENLIRMEIMKIRLKFGIRIMDVGYQEVCAVASVDYESVMIALG